MAGKELVIKYLPDGNVEIEGFGFPGRECLAASMQFELALGINGANSRREMKPGDPIRQAGHAARHRNRTSL